VKLIKKINVVNKGNTGEQETVCSPNWSGNKGNRGLEDPCSCSPRWKHPRTRKKGGKLTAFLSPGGREGSWLQP
jgi:hypothetical protein